MKRKFTLLIAAGLLGFGGVKAQSACTDLNGFVDYKNVGVTGSYALQAGALEYAAQTYNYSGPGKIAGVRVYGNYPGIIGGVPLRVGVYNVDASGRPTTPIQTVNTIWWVFNNPAGFISVVMPGGGVSVSSRFAITVQLLNAFPFGNNFNLRYTGSGEGLGQDLASLAGTSTGFNWTSAMSNFNSDGDFYLVPNMVNYNNTSFSVASVCQNTGTPVSFVNTTQMTRDSMFNKIGLYGYAGGSQYFTWNFGDGSPASNATNPSHSYSTPGVYTVSLQSRIDGWSGLCTNTYSMRISVGLSALVSANSSVSCNGGTGSVTASAAGGAPTYSYSLNGLTYQSGAGFTGLSAGTHTLYVKDNLGCVNSRTFAMLQPSPVVFNTPLYTNASCGNADGAFSVSATGGAGSLQYQLNGGSFQPAGTFTGLAAGVYTLTAKDANNCTASTLVTINDAGGPSISNINGSQVSCFGGTNGAITINAAGGSGSLLYSINGGTNFQAGNSFNALGSGTYAIVVKDAAGCLDLGSFVINQPPALVVSASAVSASCFGAGNGQVNVLGSTGGTGLHNYSLNGLNYQSGLNFSSLSAGTYTVYVRDVANCIATTTLTVGQPQAVSANVTTTATACNGSPNGLLNVIGSGGTGLYQYSLNGLNFQPTGLFSNLASGNYMVTVRDANNCTFTTTAFVNQPAAITTTVGSTNSTCGNTNGGILVIGGGGAGNFQYSIDGINYVNSGAFSPLASGTYYVIVRDQSNCTTIVAATVNDSNGPVILNESHTNISCNGGSNGSINITNVTGGAGQLQYSINGLIWQSSPVFGNLPAGVYMVTVKDANGCTGTMSISLTQPNPFVINSVVSNVPCNGSASGSATVTAAGGAGVLAYSINNGINFQSTGLFNNLPAGTYNVLVKDAANCTGIQTFYITEPRAIELSLGILNVLCSGAGNGAITIGASGGTGPLLYSLNGSVYSNTNVYVNLPGNMIYQVAVKDGNGCVKTQTALITQPAPVMVSASQNNVSCAGGNNGAINLSVNGGVYPYSFSWSNGNTTQGLFNLSAGTYSVLVTDYNGCTSAHSYTLTQPANPLVINANVIPASSAESNDGSIDITVTGGSQPYTFSWSNGTLGEDISSLPPGAYLITVTDANGCISSATFIVGNVLGLETVLFSSDDLRVYPNPANDYAIIEAKGRNITKVQLVNVIGQTVLELEPGSSSVELRTAGLARGAYFVKVFSGSQLAIKRVALID